MLILLSIIFLPFTNSLKWEKRESFEKYFT